MALSRLRSLEGLHLLSFDPNSITVSQNCLSKIKRLRETYRKDLTSYPLPKTAARKHKLTGKSVIPQPPAKKPLTDGHLPAQRKVYGELKFHSVDSQWQRGACATLGILYKLLGESRWSSHSSDLS